jgi:hypothetical protein
MATAEVAIWFSAGVINLFKPASAVGWDESDVYLEDVVAAPARDTAPREEMCRHTSLGFGKSAR